MARVCFQNAAQQSAHPTLGSLATSQAVSHLSLFLARQLHHPHPSATQVSHKNMRKLRKPLSNSSLKQGSYAKKQ